MNNIAISSLSISMPKKHYSNDEPPYSEISNIPTNWWRFWGIKGRYLLDREEGETALQHAIKASKESIRKAKINLEDVDLVLCNSTCFAGWSEEKNRVFPRFAHRLKEELGIPNALAIDVEQECITFLISVQIASNYIKTGRYKNVLVCSSEYISSVLDFSDLSCSTFGDGTAAAIISADAPTGGLIASSYGSDAEFYDVATVKWKYPQNSSLADQKPEDFWSYFSIDKNAPAEMQKFVPQAVPRVINQALEKANLTSEDIDFYIFHQPSKILVDLWANAMRIDDDKFLLTLNHYGCMVSVSMPVTLYEALKQGKIKPGDKVVIAGAATGWGFGAQIWEVGDIQVN
jgi:3-oxoacyl-[acyl-carrier-protein] synthase-3